MTTINSYEEFLSLKEKEPFFLVYSSRPGCGVCSALKPKIEALLSEIPGLKGYYADLEALPLMAGQLSLFAVPVILVFCQGKETIREARNLSLEPFKEKLLRLSRLIS